MTTDQKASIPDQIMLVIMALDPAASLKFSQQTRQWRVAARVDIDDGQTITAVVEHADSPDLALESYFKVLVELSADKFIVARPYGQRREYRWNGAAFAEIPNTSSASS